MRAVQRLAAAPGVRRAAACEVLQLVLSAAATVRVACFCTLLKRQRSLLCAEDGYHHIAPCARPVPRIA
eukprot:1404433-Rhodomonas_salina.1